MEILFNIFVYSFFPILMISFVICIHELGHYWAARSFDASIKSFSLGFGDKIWGVTDRRGTTWKLSWLPLGGFVSFYEEEFDDGTEHRPDGIPIKDLSPLKRIVIALAGPFANFALSITIFAAFGMLLGSPKYEFKVQTVEASTPAEMAGLQVGDIFVSLNGKAANRQDRFQSEIKLSAGQPIDFVIQRGDEQLALTATPERALVDNGIGIKQKFGRLGFSYTSQLMDENKLNLFEALGFGVDESIYTVSNSVRMIGKIFTGKESIHSLSGPVGIANAVGTSAKVSLEAETTLQNRLILLVLMMSQLAAMISVAIGFLNLLPLPVLDGGNVVFNAYEAVTGRMPSKRLQAASANLAFLLLIFMLVFITFGDFGETGLLELFRGL